MPPIPRKHKMQITRLHESQASPQSSKLIQPAFSIKTELSSETQATSRGKTIPKPCCLMLSSLLPTHTHQSTDSYCRICCRRPDLDLRAFELVEALLASKQKHSDALKAFVSCISTGLNHLGLFKKMLVTEQLLYLHFEMMWKNVLLKESICTYTPYQNWLRLLQDKAWRKCECAREIWWVLHLLHQ